MHFEIKGRTELYHGRAFAVQTVDLILPDGRAACYDLVVHRGAVVIVPVDAHGNIWFVRQYRLGAAGMLVELPAGVLELGEPPEVTALREIREEIGQAAEQIEKIGEFFLTPGYSTEFLHIFLASGLHPERLQADADEFLETISYPVEQVYDMVRTGQIRDGKTLAALLLAQPLVYR